MNISDARLLFFFFFTVKHKQNCEDMQLVPNFEGHGTHRGWLENYSFFIFFAF